MNDYWDRESWCSLKHLLKAEVNAKESFEKAIRNGGSYEPDRGSLRNVLTAIGNTEAASGHFEEFAIKYIDLAEEEEDEDKVEEHLDKAVYYIDIMDSTRFVRQKLVKSLGLEVKQLGRCIRWIGDLIDMHVDFMRGESTDGQLRVKTNGE